LFKGRYGSAAFNLDDTIIIYGGFDDEICDDALQLDVKRNVWSRKRYQGYTLTPMFREIPPRDFFAYACNGTEMFICGGKTKTNQRLIDVYQWRLSSRNDSHLNCTLRQDIVSFLMIIGIPNQSYV
jgi:hypothetical protein